MSKSEGFTLVEVIAVIIIIGVIMLVAVPSYTEYVASSRKSAYVSNVKSYVESARGGAYSKLYGALPESDELLVIPYSILKLEKNNENKSPYAPYVVDRSYIVMVGRATIDNLSVVYDYYVVFVDENNNGINNVASTRLDRKDVLVLPNPGAIPTVASLSNGSKKLTYNSITYSKCSTDGRGGAILMCAD